MRFDGNVPVCLFLCVCACVSRDTRNYSVALDGFRVCPVLFLKSLVAFFFNACSDFTSEEAVFFLSSTVRPYMYRSFFLASQVSVHFNVEGLHNSTEFVLLK